MDTLISNITVVTMNEKMDVLFGAYIGVKDGKIASPVRGASLIGRGSEILHRIDRVGREMTMGQGMCGSRSGSVPTNVGQPTIRVSRLTVGGK